MRPVVALLALVPSVAFSQRYDITTFGIEEGLPQSQVSAICQDRQGFLWIGTYGGGVSRYDGRTFRNFTTRDGVADNLVLSIAQDHADNVWFGTFRGVSRFDGHTFKDVSAQTGLIDTPVRAIVVDRGGAVWFGTNRGACRYDGTKTRCFTASDGLAANTVRTALEDREGNLWFGTDAAGVSRYDGRAFTTFNRDSGLPSNTVFAVSQDREGAIWFGTSGGAARYDGHTFTSLTTAHGLGSNSVRSILEDRYGDMWFGTDGGGLGHFGGNLLTTITTRNGLRSDTVWALIEDRDANLWVGTYRGGISKLRRSGFVRHAAEDGLGADIVRAIIEDRQGNLWFATQAGGVTRLADRSFTTFTERNGLASDFVLTAFEDRQGNLWFGTSYGVSRYDGSHFRNLTTRDGLPDPIIRSITQDRNDNLWFATNSGGVTRYDGSGLTTFTTADGLGDNQVLSLLVGGDGTLWAGTLKGIAHFDGTRFIGVPAGPGSRRSPIIAAMLETNDGRIWLATYGGGVVAIEPHETGDPAVVTTVTEADGLSSDNAVSLVLDGRGGIWIGTERGADRFDLAEYLRSGSKHVEHHDNDDGFSAIECMWSAALRDRRGNLWFGTSRGAVEYSPTEDRRASVEPLIHLTGLRLFLRDPDWTRFSHIENTPTGLPIGLVLPYDQNYLTFDFIGINLRVPKRVQYRYRLIPFDKGWSPPSGDTYVTYSNLPSGAYTFEVVASESKGEWDKTPASVAFEIAPPFWRRWWFLAICGASALLTVTVTARAVSRWRYATRLEAEVEMRKHLQAQLEKSQASFASIVEKNADGVIVVGRDGIVKFANPAACSLFGKSRSTLEGTDFDLEVVTAGVSEVDIPSEGSGNGTAELVVANTEWEGEGARLVLIRDITERRYIEEQLRQAQRMEAVGRLAGGVAHDFNNLLQAMLALTEVLRSRVKDLPDLASVLAEQAKLVQHGASLTRQLLLFSRRETSRREDLDLNAVVADTMRLVQRLVRENISLEVALAGGELSVKGDRGQLGQLLVNLVVNAVDAMPLGGRLEVRTGLGDGDGVFLEVEDTGCGIPREVLGKIFDPFFTTKEAGKGTGLGLSVVHGIVDDHAGRVEVESVIGHGSTFRVWLPRRAPTELRAAAEASAVDGSDEPHGHEERVLVIEDEAMALQGLVHLLTMLGYQVTGVASAEEAALLPPAPKFDVLLTDIMLPGESGIEAARALSQRWPGLKVIVMSGYTEDEVARKEIASGRLHFLEKPFDMATLARELDRSLKSNQ